VNSVGVLTFDGLGTLKGSATVNQPGPNGSRTIAKVTVAGTYSVESDGTGTMSVTVMLPNGTTSDVTEDFVITKAANRDGMLIATCIFDAQEQPSVIISGDVFVTHTYTRRPVVRKNVYAPQFKPSVTTVIGGSAVSPGDYAGFGGHFVGGMNASSYGGFGVYAIGGNGYWAGAGLWAPAGTGLAYYAAVLEGDAFVLGNLTKGGGSFQIDHPLDPANKYLYHSFVESPDMMNIYNGNVVTDGGGNATVTLPDWFEALNRDFRYQLTTVGQPAQAWIATEVGNHSFTIRTDRPNVKVSWQVTGVRQDAWANAHRIPVEVDKKAADQGHYLHPELFGHAGDPNIIEMHHPRPNALRRPE
jgi:hypothetical protein